RIGEIFDRPDPLLQFIEYCRAAVEHGAGVHRRLDASRAALEQRHTERALEVGDDSGDGRLRQAQLRGRLSHASALTDGEQYVQVAQLDAATVLVLAIEFLTHACMLAKCQGDCNLRV